MALNHTEAHIIAAALSLPTLLRKKDIALVLEHIESIARRLLPDIMAYYQSEEGQREFTEWKAEQEKLKTSKDNNSGKSV